ncbi:tRNA (guanine-N(7)-)-methyltransferase non-catalytic subunit trm82 [Knufia obscura]|uniref:tRNA (Guanine-N(7)-)-methyltransferase non-catalytic subunit trm82 n=2 Tax=Knufia TaxID=430999 RepID=A0AAN8F282_9EURO|nr:tRNA (guanine-N(7)-)-methyltransferase non-catalytic subunit trm82 [Knufia obscura]KAK5958681.1 tRNA (guanine-N(7)-)-methyltransferase non-catalytic subunit trm82 [Knufia fluminis]
MTNLHYPANKLCLVYQDSTDIILAATGTYIQSLSLTTKKPFSIWPREDVGDPSDDEDLGDDRPAKRPKLETGEKPSLRLETSEASEASIDIKVEGKPRQKGERRTPKIPDTSLPHVSHLIATSDGKHAIAVTAEDKAVRVFGINKSGNLKQLSSRSLPKKSCAITLSHDEKTILAADKFGDVYAVPLLPTTDYQRKTLTPQLDKGFKPSASELTVHTKGNLDALKQQQLQKQKHARKEGPDFEHKLVLGHVSLLTDLAIATGEVEGKDRPFILTSDRDEHIRVSRGIPQTHVIHSFCLGHTEFVSKLCIVPWDPKVLIAGNGEPSLRVYDWQAGQEHSRYDILEHLRDEIESVLPPERSIDKLAVSGIWPVSCARAQDGEPSRHALLVALEGLPLLFSFQLSNFGLRHIQTVKLESNVLEALFLPKHNVVVVTVDTAHPPGFYKGYRAEPVQKENDFKFYGLRHGEIMSDLLPIEGVCLEPSSDAALEIMPIPIDSLSDKRATDETEARAKYEKTYSALGELIYGLENLRKRRGKAAEEEDDVADEGEGEGELEGAPDIDTAPL